MTIRRSPALAVLVVSMFVLASCQTIEEKVDRLYAESQDFAAEGDVDRALLLLRSLFDLDGEHLDARMFYADLTRDRRDLKEAYGHYLLVAEQYPNHLPARIALAEIAVQFGQWNDVERHLEVALTIDPDNADLAGLRGAVDYRELMRSGGTEGLDEILQAAEARIEENPGDLFSRRILIDNLVRSNDPGGAIVAIDDALQVAPADEELNRLKLALLAETEDLAALGAHLQQMVQLFPDDRELRTSLVRWYLANDDADGAEDFVRSLVAEAGDEIAPRVALVQFLAQVRGSDAAIAETDTLIEEGLADTMFRTLRAGLDYDAGRPDTAIADMRALLEDAEATAETQDARITLARMLLAQGGRDEAQSLTEQVLADDPRHVEALKLKAGWLIDDDLVRDAVLALRTALDQSPRDPDAITLLARAYERDGSLDLMGDSLALAFDASNAAPEESLRYARWLIRGEKHLAAEDVLLRMLRLNPRNQAGLRSLAEVYVAMADWPRADQVVRTMRGLGDPDAARQADEIAAVILQRRQRTDESLALLRNVIDEGTGGLTAKAAVIRTHLAQGEVETARRFMDELLAEPGEPSNRAGIAFLNAALLAVEGRYDAAKAEYRTLLQADPQSELVWRALVATTLREGARDEADAIVDEALTALPESATLLWIKAGFAERDGQVDEAIAIYDRLYEADSGSPVIANNLASLITTYRADDESLQRAYVIARRLRGSQVPAFQDTYGWIAYRLGNLTEALEHLEPAARGLPNDPRVQYHLGKVYAAMERPQDAVDQFELALSIAPEGEADYLQDARALAEAQRALVPAPN